MNYRKQVSHPRADLAPADDFQLYAVCARHPAKLAREVEMKYLRPGVLETRWGTHVVRILIASEMPRVERNALWQLFSGRPDGLEFGASHYHWRDPDLSGVLDVLRTMEGYPMPYTVEDFKREQRERLLRSMSMEDRLQMLSAIPPEERLRGLSVEEVLRAIPVEKVEQYLRSLQGDREEGENGDESSE